MLTHCFKKHLNISGNFWVDFHLQPYYAVLYCILYIVVYPNLLHCLHRFIPEAWSPCSVTCGRGMQVREIKCRILLTFTQTELELPDEECEDEKPALERTCHMPSCHGDTTALASELLPEWEYSTEIYDWEYIGFTPCSSSCSGGTAHRSISLLSFQIICSQETFITEYILLV